MYLTWKEELVVAVGIYYLLLGAGVVCVVVIYRLCSCDKKKEFSVKCRDNEKEEGCDEEEDFAEEGDYEVDKLYDDDEYDKMERVGFIASPPQDQHREL
tara:strand:- start:55 stop:351 length:297 start_codon:yes stop_codon:yes gene_type:complete